MAQDTNKVPVRTANPDTAELVVDAINKCFQSEGFIANLKERLGIAPRVAEGAEQGENEGFYYDKKTKQIIYTDPTAEDLDKAEKKALDALPVGIAVYRGKGSSTIINHSRETLDTIRNVRRGKRPGYHRERV